MSSAAEDQLFATETAASADAVEVLTPSPSTDSSAATGRSAATVPASPARTPQLPHQQQPLPSLPNTPAPNAPADRSPAVTPTPSQRMQGGDPWTPNANVSEANGVVLGLEQLERQQDEAERRRREQRRVYTTPNSHHARSIQSSQQSTPRRYIEDDDEHTAPSSITRDAASHTGDGSLGSGDDLSSQRNSSNNNNKESTKFQHMIRHAKVSVRKLQSKSSKEFLRRRNSGDVEDPADEDEQVGAGDAIIYGHLQKLGRNGKWQTRWFESDGECLSYYKTSKRSKLLATLDLEKVGGIVVNEDDPKGCSFTIQVLGRPYYLRAESRAACKDWVITLNRVKEARLQQGNVKLVHKPKHMLKMRSQSPPDLLDGNVSTYTQGVVAHANRQRTRAVALENIEEMMQKEKEDPSADTELELAYEETESLSQVVLARWQKKKTSMSKLAGKLSRWARSLNKYKCNAGGEGDVRLDRHVHPPGHDNAAKRHAKQPLEREEELPPNDQSLSGWIGKETSRAVKAGPVVMEPDEDDDDHVLPTVEVTPSDPVANSVSSGSSDNADEDDEETRELS